MSEQYEQANNTLNFTKKHGLSLVPMQTVNPETGLCSCGKVNCNAVGKHPRKKGWQNGPFLEKIEDFVISFNDIKIFCNSAVATTANIVVLDCDSTESYSQLISDYPELKNTPTVKTGKGFHLYLKSTFKLSNRVRVLKDIDIKTTGGLATTGGSVHYSGALYTWLNLESELVTFPEKLILKINDEKSPANKTNEVRIEIPEGKRNDEFFKLACDSLTKGLSPLLTKEVLLSLNTKACKPPLEEAEIEQIILSAIQTTSRKAQEPSFDLSKLHGPLATIVKKVDPYTEANPIAVYIQMLAIVGNYFGRTCGSHVSGDRHYTNLFTLIVGNSSVSRKGTSLGVAKAVLKQIIPDFVLMNLKSGATSGEGIAFHLRDPIWEDKTRKRDGRHITEKVLVDQGVTDKRLTVVESEFGSVLISMKREGNKLSTTVRDAFDSINLSTLSKNNSVKASEPHISIIAHITAQELDHLLDKVDIFNGFGNRFLYIYTKSDKCLPHAPSIEDIDLKEEINSLKEAVEFWSTAMNSRFEVRVKFTRSASEHWEKIYPALKEPKANGSIETFLSRGPAHVKKIAITLAMLDKKNEIDVCHLNGALAIWDYSVETVKFIFKDHVREVSKPALKALRYFEKVDKDLVSRTAISSDCFQRNVSAEELNRIQHELIEAGKINIVQDAGGETWELVTTDLA